MSTYKTEGIIIKRSNFGEASLLLHIYTKDYGKVEAVARSARKAKGKLKGHLELFLHSDFLLAHGRNIDTVTSSVAVENYLNLRKNLEFSFGVYYILELIDKMTIEGHKDERIFCLLKRAFLFMDKLANNERRCLSLVLSRGERDVLRNFNVSNIIILLFQINLLNLTGFSPELNKCIFCGKPIKSGENYFSFFMGGVIGQECSSRKEAKEAECPTERSASRVSISDNAIKLLRLFQFKGKSLKEYNLHFNKSFETIKKLKADKKLVLNSVFLMNKFIEFNIERKIKGVDFLRGV